MTRSMTGFARGERELETGRLSVELRSVNHRYLETGWRLPEDLRGLEPELRAATTKRLARGKLDCTLTWRPTAAASTAPEVDRRQAAQLIHAAREIYELLDLPETELRQSLDPLAVLGWPGVLQQAPIDLAPVREAACALFNETLTQLIEMREHEGERTALMIEERLAALGDWVKPLRARIPAIRAQLAERLRTRLAELDLETDPARLEQELTIAATRLDVDEELDRLEAHIAATRSALHSDKPIGRRLDFLMQEMNREANTLGSKSQHLDSTQAAIEAKVLIEQMREQVQNLE